MENNFNLADCPAMETIALIGGRWKLRILKVICQQPRRFGEIHVRLPAITRKVLTDQLRELESDGLITRTAFNEVPRKVMYALTEFGHSLHPLLDYIAAWKKHSWSNK
jgi:DNA-binding HxlR family transcriptional regulator